MPISYVSDFEELTGKTREQFEAEVQAKVVGAPETEKPAAKTTASTKAK